MIIDEPVGPYYGGVIAAPVFAAVMQDMLQYLKIAPQSGSAFVAAAKEAHVLVPSVINFAVADAVGELKKAGLGGRIEESGDRVADQIPKPGSLVPPGSSILLYTVTPRYLAGEVTVPTLSGQIRPAGGRRSGGTGTGRPAVRDGDQGGQTGPAAWQQGLAGNNDNAIF